MKNKVNEIEVAMKSICDYYATADKGHEIDASFLCRGGVREEKEAIALINKLCAMHLITYESEYISGGETIKLTDEGKLFHIKKREARENEKRQFAHDWKIAVFSALAGAFLSMPLWKAIGWVISLLQ